MRVMPYLYKVVLGVTGAEGSSEEEVEPLGSPLSPEELVVLLRVHVELPLGIAPGILWEEEHPTKPGGRAPHYARILCWPHSAQGAQGGDFQWYCRS